MNRQQVGPGQPLRNMTNMTSMGSQQTQSRNTTPGSRLVSSKSGAWGSNSNVASQSISQSQSQDPGNSWALATNPNARPNAQLDLSSTAFPSLAGGSTQSHTPGSSTSQWQAGPPPREQTQSQNSRMIQQRQPNIISQRDHAFGNDYSSLDQTTARFQSHNALPRGAPPGLAPTDGMSPDSGPGSSQPRKSPIPQNVNGNIGQERSNGDANNHSPPSGTFGLPRGKETFSMHEALSPIMPQEQSLESMFKGMTEEQKWGVEGFRALHEGPMAEFKAQTRAQDLASFENQAASGQPLLRSYAGPFAPPHAYAPRPLDSDFTIPECYVVQNVAPIQQRISGFTEDTLFYIFYTSPKDIIQEEVATELMSRKWRFHMKEKMWLTRDDTTQSPTILEKDVSEQGYYIWWDFRAWKRVRRSYVLRYEDLDDHLSGGRSLAMPGLFQGGFGMMGGMNGSSMGNAGAGGFNAVPGLERMAALQGGRF